MNWSACTENVDVATIKCLEVVFKNVVSVLTGLAAIILFIMLIVGGFQYLTSVGNPKGVEAAQGTLTAAILGIILLVVAFLVLLLLSNVTGLSLTSFIIPDF